MATIRTGASAYLKYEYETSVMVQGGTPNKKFGLQDKLTNWTLTHNRIDMPQLNQTTMPIMLMDSKMVVYRWDLY